MARDLTDEAHRAAQVDDVPWIESLIAEGCDIHAADEDGTTALHHAAHYGNIRVLKFIALAKTSLAEFSDNSDPSRGGRYHAMANSAATLLNAADHNGVTPAHIAASFGSPMHVKVLEFIWDMGSDMSTSDESGRTPADYADMYDNTTALDLLTRHGFGTNPT
jgi:ankyrin repeat protein